MGNCAPLWDISRFWDNTRMAQLSSRTRFAPLRAVFAEGRSPLLNRLAQLSVLYEDLRIETFGISTRDDLPPLDYLDSRYRVHYFLRRSIATLLEFEGALGKLSGTQEYKSARRMFENQPDKKDLIRRVSAAIRFFHGHHDTLKSLRNSVGGHFHDEAAGFATKHADPRATAQLVITFDPSGRGGGPKLYYAGEIAVTAFTRDLPGIKSREEEIEHVIRTIRAGYSKATEAMHALIIVFLWERFQSA